ncbi:MAG TPA: glucose-1-phosphate thymidylyltransferase RfbA [Acidimicrobiia bacterium]|nr:glucose-1-phosphate thymidylyltransferase RfbA [Acidimicrobiia bacterium]
MVRATRGLVAPDQGGRTVKGILLAGGAGSRLDPITRVASKQLQPVYDKPMIYYPLATLMQAGIRQLLLITTPEDMPRFQALLGDGSMWGIEISYAVQPEPKGIAQAFIIGSDFVGSDPVTLILGDNIFYGRLGLEEVVAEFRGGAFVFGYPVRDPERYGVVEFDKNGTVLSLEEKPSRPRSRFAVPGIYVYDAEVVKIASSIQPSGRDELEITDVNKVYLERGELRVQIIDRGVAWLDSGTHDSLLEAANFIATIEHRQSIKIACLEEIALYNGFVTRAHFDDLVAALPNSPYRQYLESLSLDEV